MEWYLVHAAVRTCLVPHLLCTCPRSPPSSIVPHIHAAQGPPDCDLEDCEGEDSLKRQQVKSPRSPSGSALRKCKCELPHYIYCLKCHSEDPGHETSNCPYVRSCRYCWSTFYQHHKCPSPHLTCSTTRCLVPSLIGIWGLSVPPPWWEETTPMRCTSQQGITTETMRVLPLTDRWNCQARKGIMSQSVRFVPLLFFWSTSFISPCHFPFKTPPFYFIHFPGSIHTSNTFFLCLTSPLSFSDPLYIKLWSSSSYPRLYYT